MDKLQVTGKSQMNDDTRDDLLLAVAEWIACTDNVRIVTIEDRVAELLKQAQHERNHPHDRGA